MLECLPSLNIEYIEKLIRMVKNSTKNKLSYTVKFYDNTYYRNSIGEIIGTVDSSPAEEEKISDKIVYGTVEVELHVSNIEDVFKIIKDKNKQVSRISISVTHKDDEYNNYSKYIINPIESSLEVDRPIVISAWDIESLKRENFQLGKKGIRELTIRF